MVVRVRQAMTVPHSAYGRSNGCKLASHLQSGKDLSEKLVTMDRSKCAMENGRHGKHEPALTYDRTGSEGSQSSMESLTAGELGFSPGEIPTQSHFRKGKGGEEVTLDALGEDYVNRKSRRHFIGGAAHPHSAASLVDEDRGSTASEDGTDMCTRVKFMCSFGGKIFPRPSDGKLRYVGGDTKIIAVNRDTNFHGLLAKMTEVYGENLIFKYQLPDEDLDALVSVTSYEDLQNMMEEYDKLEKADKSSRLRVFLFPATENDSTSVLKDSAGDLRNSEQRYVDAVNGISEAGSRIRMETYVSSAPVFPVDNLISIDGPEAWSIPRVQEPGPIPKIVHAHDVASHILRVPCGVPVSSIPSRPNASSAPSSAPSSPPLLSRQTHGKLPVMSDIHLPYHQETLAKLGAPFSLLTTEGNYSENESYVGSGASSATASQLEPHYRNAESRRGPESPTRKQHESGHHDLHLRPEQRRFTEAKMPRVGSHGKLSRLAEHSEVIPTIGETQQIPDALERLFQQQQQSLHQGVWPHGESPQESYRRPELLQPSLLQQQGYQQQQPLLLRTGVQGVSNHDAGYRPDDQSHADEVLHHMPRSLSSHAIATASGQPSGYHVGSAPSSPRLGYPSRHVPSAQQIPPHWAFGGAALPEQPSYGRRKNYSDQWERPFRLSNSPPKYRDNMDFTEERLMRQQGGLGISDAAHHEQVSTSAHLGYDSNVGAVPYDLLSRPQVPLYKGQNAFQEKALFQDHQDIGDGRRQLPQRIDSQYITGKQQQQHLHSTQNQRHEFHDPLLQTAEQIPGTLRYPEAQLKVTDWDSDDPRLRSRSRARTLEDDFHVDSGTLLQKEVLQGSYSSLHLPETSDELLSSSVGDLTSVQGMEHAGNSSFQFRPGMPTPGALPGYGGHMSRTNHADTLAGPRYVNSRTSDSDYHVARGFRTGNNIQDVRTPAFDVSGHPYTSSGLIQGMQLPSSHRVDERPATADNSFSHQLKNFRIAENVNLGHEIRWNGGSGPDDIRIVDRPPGLPTPHMPRVASRLSRPSSSTNIPSLGEDLEEGVHIQPSTMQIRVTNLMDDDPPHQYPSRAFTSSENIPFSVSAAKPANPLLKTDPLPATSTDLYALEPKTGMVSSPEYLVLKADLPSIKTTATQVPSVEDDDSGGTTCTSGGSSRSFSNRGSGDLSLEPMAMTQHLAEDMASCVLEPSPTNVRSPVGAEDSEDTSAFRDQPKQPLDITLGLSSTIWDHTPHSEEECHNEPQFGKLSPKPRPTVEEELQPVANISSDSDPEDARPELPRVVSSKNIVDTAAEEAREHGLQTIKNDDLEELRELGSGTFGTVYYGKWRGTDVAIKRIKASCFAGRPSEQERLIADFWREARNLGNLHHPNVVAFYGVVSDGPGGTLATVTEYMVNGSLKQVLQKKDRTIDRRKRHLIAMDSAFGMEYLHEKKVVHFDLKCENLLVNMRDPHRPVCKVGDLGLSKVKRQTMVSGGVRGTLPWMAPELLSNSSNLVTEKVDVFSFGVVMWELLTGEEPYANMHYGAIIGGIVNNTLRPVVPSWCDPRWRSLMERCWASDPGSRPSFSEIASELRSMSECLKPRA